MSITSNNCDVHWIYQIILDEGDSVVAELKSTNKFMYRGSGAFNRFKKDEIELNEYLHTRKLNEKSK